MRVDADPRPLLLRGGRVYPLDGGFGVAPALLLHHGRVVGAGAEAELRAQAGNDLRVLELDGATVLPGLVDTHPHLLHFAARSGQYVDIADARDHAEIVARIRERAAGTPAGAWIVTTPVGEPFYFLRRSWRDLAEGGLPDRHVLDRATTEHPVFIAAYGPVTPNVCAFNSAGLARLGIAAGGPGPDSDVTVETDAAGQPTGILCGPVNNYYTFDPYWTRILARLPGMEDVDIAATTRRAMADYNARGVTTVYEGHNMTRAQIGVYERLRAEGALSVRVLAAMEAEVTAFPPLEPLPLDAFMANLEQGAALTRRDDDWLRIDGLTLALGGPCWPGFLRMDEPYTGPFGRPTRGMAFASPEKLDAFIRFCAERAVRANYVAGSYRDHDDFLDACEAQAGALGLRGRHWLVQHAILTTERQARRYKALDFDITTSMSFCWGKGDLYGERIGCHVWPDLVPLQRLIDAGLRVGCGSDWGPKNIFEHLMLAQTHEFCGSGHRNDGPGHAVSRAQSIALWTRDAAQVLQWPGVGTLAPGSHADLIVLDRDPLRCDLEALPKTQVLATLLAGTPVHDTGALVLPE